MVSLLRQGQTIMVDTPYNAAFVAAFKAAVPHNSRRWDPLHKVWLIEPFVAPLVAKLIKTHYGEDVEIPAAPTTTAAPVTKLVQMMYLGRCKERQPGITTASGFADGSWSLSFSETVLRAYFNDELSTPEQPQAPSSLYATLGIKAFSDAEAIKIAYRRMAKVWHPDVSKEPDATQRFQAINHAWSILKDDRQRRKYDVGLTLELRTATPQVDHHTYVVDDYRAPLTCGLLMVEGIERLGVLQVSTIHAWQDITNPQGQIMVSSWSMDDNNFVTRWS